MNTARWKISYYLLGSPERSVLSLTAASGKPSSTCLGKPLKETSTSTSTGKASIPTRAKVWNLESILITFDAAIHSEDRNARTNLASQSSVCSFVLF